MIWRTLLALKRRRTSARVEFRELTMKRRRSNARQTNGWASPLTSRGRMQISESVQVVVQVGSAGRHEGQHEVERRTGSSPEAQSRTVVAHSATEVRSQRTCGRRHEPQQAFDGSKTGRWPGSHTGRRCMHLRMLSAVQVPSVPGRSVLGSSMRQVGQHVVSSKAGVSPEPQTRSSANEDAHVAGLHGGRGRQVRQQKLEASGCGRVPVEQTDGAQVAVEQSRFDGMRQRGQPVVTSIPGASVAEHSGTESRAVDRSQIGGRLHESVHEVMLTIGGRFGLQMGEAGSVMPLWHRGLHVGQQAGGSPRTGSSPALHSRGVEHDELWAGSQVVDPPPPPDGAGQVSMLFPRLTSAQGGVVPD